MEAIPKIGKIAGLEEIARTSASRASDGGSAFADTLKNAVEDVAALQRESDAAQTAYAHQADVDLHDVLIKVEEAEIAFKTMMEVRNKLVSAYQDILRMGG